MIRQIRLCLKHAGRLGGRETVSFQAGLNVLVGPNGSGKSSLLRAIHTCRDCEREEDEGMRYRFFDSETMNPHRSQAAFKGVTGSIVKVRAMFSSHGETMRDVLSGFRFENGDCLLLDEPEEGHDIQWIIRIRRGLGQIAAAGCQIILASHHPVFWRDAALVELEADYRNKAAALFLPYVADNPECGRE